jgi:hypothetical protein
LRGEPVGSGQLGGHVAAGDDPGRPGDRPDVEAGRDGPGGPLGAEVFEVGGAVLGCAGGQSCGPGRRGAGLAVAVEVLRDLGPASGEHVPLGPTDPVDFGDTLGHRGPADPEGLGQPGPQRGLVEIADGLGPPVDGLPVGGRPAAVLGPGQVGGDQVGVQLRVAGPRRAVPEPGGDESAGRDPDGAAVPPAGHDRLRLQGGEGVGHRGVVRGDHLGCGDRVGQGPQEADGLGGGERQVEPGHPPRTPGTGDEGVPVGVAAVEDGPEPVGVDWAGEAERGGQPAVPHPGELDGVQVVLVTHGERRQVVILPPGGELPDRQHHAPSRRARRPHRQCRPGWAGGGSRWSPARGRGVW